MPNYDILETQITDILAINEDNQLSHALDTRMWVITIDPNASMLLQIAALGHDIDRSVEPRSVKGEDEDYAEYKQRHANRSAEIIANMILNLNFKENQALVVASLISKHEIGGDPESDILRDADSLSYFAHNINGYIEKFGREVTLQKIKFMYDRCSPRAQQLISTIEFDDEVRELVEMVIH
jgi:hypothetical protein